MWQRVFKSRLWISAGVVVILAAALIGGGVFIQKRGEQARIHSAEVAVQQQKDNQKSDNNHNQATGDNSDQPTPDQGSAPSEPATGNSAGELPETGPEGFLGTAFVLALLTYMAMSYMRSRRLASSL